MSTTNTRWQHLEVPGPTAEHLTALGRAGWEIVAAVATDDGSVCYLKRPALSFRDRVTLDQQRHYYEAVGQPLPDGEGAER
jgi:hypothetical protein